MKRKIKATQACAFMAQQAQHLLKKTGPTGPSRFEEKRDEKRDIPVKNGIPQIRTDKCSTVFGPVSVYVVPFSVPFPFIPEKTKTVGKKRYTVADETGFIPSVFILDASALSLSWVIVVRK
jgi:hypothetical protein